MKADRGAVLRRLARLYALTKESRYRPEMSVLATELECSERTVRRYLKALADSRVALPKGWTQDGREAA